MKKVLWILFVSIFIIKLAKCQDIKFEAYARDSAGDTKLVPMTISIVGKKIIKQYGSQKIDYDVILKTPHENVITYESVDKVRIWVFKSQEFTLNNGKKKTIMYQVHELVTNKDGTGTVINYYKKVDL